MDSRTIQVVYCDDVRQEVGNKQSWMGIYAGELIVPDLPAVLGKLCMAVTVTTPSERPFGRLRLMANVDDVTAFEVSIPEPDLSAAPRLEPVNELDDVLDKRIHMSVVLAISPFPIERPCFVQVLVETETEGEVLKSRKLRIRTTSAAGARSTDAPAVPG